MGGSEGNGGWIEILVIGDGQGGGIVCRRRRPLALAADVQGVRFLVIPGQAWSSKVPMTLAMSSAAIHPGSGRYAQLGDDKARSVGAS
eukprot:scaffold67089_cov34-Tisochrysis_lutea.AAC.3